MGRAWEMMKAGRGESPAEVVTEPEVGVAVAIRPGLAEDIYAGAFDREVGIADEYLTIEETKEGPAWHVGAMEQKAAYRSLMRDEPVYVSEPGGIREAIADIEVESSYGVFLEEVPIGDRVVLAKPGEAPKGLYDARDERSAGEGLSEQEYAEVEAEISAGELGGFGPGLQYGSTPEGED